MSRPARSKKAPLLLAAAAFVGLAAWSCGDPPPAPYTELAQPAPPRMPAAPAPAPVVAPVVASKASPALDPSWEDRLRKQTQEAVKRITLLDPDQFPEAPLELREALKKLGCRIPQSLFTYWGHLDPPWEVQDNLVPGHFKSTSELHWAVLCSRSAKTSLLLFDSQGRNMETLAGPVENMELLTRVEAEGDPAPDFSWSIRIADQKNVVEEFGLVERDGPEPPTILHDAISLGDTTYYWHRCKWVEVELGC